MDGNRIWSYLGTVFKRRDDGVVVEILTFVADCDRLWTDRTNEMSVEVITLCENYSCFLAEPQLETHSHTHSSCCCCCCFCCVLPVLYASQNTLLVFVPSVPCKSLVFACENGRAFEFLLRECVCVSAMCVCVCVCLSMHSSLWCPKIIPTHTRERKAWQNIRAQYWLRRFHGVHL